MAAKLLPIDYVILISYLAATLAMGLWIGRKVQSGKDFFLGGRRLPWWAIGMSLVATDIGGTDIIGVGGAAFSHGLAVANFEWIGCVPAMIVGAFVFIPFFYRTGVYTIPEFMERRYNAAVRTALGLCWLAFMACNLGIMLLASAKMMVSLFDWNEFRWLFDWNEFGWLFEWLLDSEVTVCILLTATLVGIYTCAGGLAAVVYTDTIQCAVMIGGCLLVLVMGLWEVGGVTELKTKLAAAKTLAHEATAQNTSPAAPPDRTEDASDDRAATDRLSLILPVDTDTPFPWTGIFFGLAMVLSPAYWIGNQAIVQRSLGAKSEFEAKAAYVWGAVLKNVIPLIIVVPGLIAVVKFPELADGDQAFPRLVGAVLPVGLRGLFLAAFVAALMSSIDSYLNSAATIMTNDLYKRFVRRDADERRLLWIGRLTTLGLVAWAVVFALLLTEVEEGIYVIFQTLMAFFQGPALAILLTGVLWRRATGVAAFFGFVGGIVTSVSLFALSQQNVCAWLGVQPLFKIAEPFLYFSVWSFLVALSLVVVISFFTRPEPPEKVDFLILRPKRENS